MALVGKAALVTGASSGIGFEIAAALSRNGVHVGACARSRTGLEELQNHTSDFSGNVHTGVVDVTEAARLDVFASEVRKKFGPITILVANAGVGIFRPIHDISAEEFKTVLDVNLLGVFYSVKTVLPDMHKQRDGDIIIINSLAGRNGFASGTAYCASKFALRGFAQSLMEDVRSENIRVISVFPGSVDTPFSAKGEARGKKANILMATDVAEAVMSSLTASRRALISELDIRPTSPS